MNIPELKKCIQYFMENGYPASAEEYELSSDRLQTLLSACQFLCDVSDKMLPKKEHIALLSNKDLLFTGKLTEHRTVKDWIKYGYNQAREEDILWITKKMMGLPEVVCPDNREDTCLDHRNCEGIANAIIQSFGQEKGRE